MNSLRRLILIEPRGFCSGVHRALRHVLEFQKEHTEPLYILYQLVHNEYVTQNLQNQGVIFVQSIEEIPPHSYVVLSAHGVPESTEMACHKRHLKIIDATCPLVKKVHHALIQYVKEGVHVVLIGHASHREIIGTRGRVSEWIPCVDSVEAVAQLPDFSGRVAFLTQTTLSEEDIAPIRSALQKRFPQLEGQGNVCYATHDRQNAIRTMASRCDAIMVVGSAQSSNTQRLRELAERTTGKGFLVSSQDTIDISALKDVKILGLTSGASTPENLFQDVVSYLCRSGFTCSVSE